MEREGGGGRVSQGVGCLGGECVRALLNLWHLFAQNLIRPWPCMQTLGVARS